jgi:hypothetical protein
MSVISKLSSRVGWPLLPAVLAAALLAGWIRSRAVDPAASAVPPDDWDIPQLVAFLNDAGLGLRIVSTQKDGVIGQAVFLTATNKEWDDLNHLPKHQKQIHQWRGTLYCEWGRAGFLMGDAWSALTRQWGDCCLVAGPFLFYGDRDLLDRVRAALAELALLGIKSRHVRHNLFESVSGRFTVSDFLASPPAPG